MVVVDRTAHVKRDIVLIASRSIARSLTYKYVYLSVVAKGKLLLVLSTAADKLVSLFERPVLWQVAIISTSALGI